MGLWYQHIKVIYLSEQIYSVHNCIFHTVKYSTVLISVCVLCGGGSIRTFFSLKSKFQLEEISCRNWT